MAAAAILVTAACSGGRVIPAPQPAPAPAPQPAPLPRPAPSTAWQQAPLTPGDWAWRMENGQSAARFAGGAFALRCDRAAASVILSRTGSAEAPAPMTIRTSAMARTLSASPDGGTAGTLAARLSAEDPLLDAMAFSRGRFAVETAGLPVLIVPSWTEVSRVIEDCR